MDIYTGRVLWEAKLPGVGRFFNNLAHQPGANSSGTNFITTSDGIYVVYGSKCLHLDLATGKKIGEFKLPAIPGMKEDARWGYINVSDNYVVGGADPLFDAKLDKVLPKGAGDDPEPGTAKKTVDKDDPLMKLLGSLRVSRQSFQQQAPGRPGSHYGQGAVDRVGQAGFSPQCHLRRRRPACTPSIVCRASSSVPTNAAARNRRPRASWPSICKPASCSGPPMPTSSAPGSATRPSTTSARGRPGGPRYAAG